ncbi:MAG: TonB-dependent receptor, partial [Ferruginibacter sp.]|nr:TonB-dependent receptor [Ferruginibacter sp.]
NTPVAKTNLNRKDIEKNNIGQDLPFILNQTPSVQVNSDAGNGIGYTNIRLRGTDASRINITINGIPYNDAESQGVFFVNLPDIAASAATIQIQRGVGTSTNGAGAFGGSIHLHTNEVDTKKSIVYSNNSGSFNSFRNSLQFKSGIFGKKFVFTGRISDIRSDGYIERAKTKLQSFFTSLAWVDDKSSLRLNVFSGKEKTYAAWFGINEAMLNTNRRYNPAGTEKQDSPYENETDNYTQTHFQLFYNKAIKPYLKANVAVFLTRGKGYFEQYKASQSLSSIGLSDYNNGTDIISSIDLVRQLWLKNDFYGTIFSLQYNKNRNNLIVGGGFNRYDGNHFGDIVFSSVKPAVPENYRWYQLNAFKQDASIFTKWTYSINSKWQSYVDLQLRMVDYRINGFRNNPGIKVKTNNLFFNPKAGISYTDKGNRFYFSYSRAAKEPNRDDFETSSKDLPKPEKLNDFEAGFEQKNKKFNWAVNLYYMHYTNQLVLTGKVNDVFAYTRTNIPESYRAGIELEGQATVNKWMSVSGNVAFSRNKILNFTEYIDNYDNGTQITRTFESSDISFSPNVIANGSIILQPFKNLNVTLISKYVGKQYLDNTSNENRALKDYFIQDARIDYLLALKKEKSINFFIQANNIFDKKYVANGYTFSYVSGGFFATENYYFPMAIFNLMSGITIKL